MAERKLTKDYRLSMRYTASAWETSTSDDGDATMDYINHVPQLLDAADAEIDRLRNALRSVRHVGEWFECLVEEPAKTAFRNILVAANDALKEG